jgi:O-antigen/teichoic acid export membrane protein
VQLLPLISAPIISRLYSPMAFGAYAVFYALVAIIGSAASLALHNAILLEKDDGAAAHAALLSLVTIVATTILVSFVLLGVPSKWMHWVFGAEVLVILPWLPLTVMGASGYLCLYTWCIRKTYFSTLARNKMVLGISTMLIQIIIGLMQLEAIGFVLANLIGYGLAIMLLLGHFRRDLLQSQHGFCPQSAKAQFKKHMRLPLYTFPAGLINTVSSQLPELIINKLFGSNLLGQYSLANRVINMPLAFLSSSVQDLFRQKASAEQNETGTCKSTYFSFLVLMLFASLLLLVPVVVFVPVLFPIVFGQQWGQSGHLIQAMAFLLAVRFISSPLSYVWIVRGKQKMDMFWQLGLLLIGIASFIFSDIVINDGSLVNALYIYSTFTGLWYVVCIFFSYRFAK